MQVTDMIWLRGSLPTVQVSPDVVLVERAAEDRGALLALVQQNASHFLTYYCEPPETTGVYEVNQSGQLVGAVLIEDRPRAAETTSDGALACLVVVERLQGQGVGSAAVVRCCENFAARGFDRVIAEWAASVPLYERLGFVVWKHRDISVDDQ